MQDRLHNTMGVLDVFFQFLPWGVATFMAVLAGIIWQGRQRLENVNKPKKMQSRLVDNKLFYR